MEWKQINHTEDIIAYNQPQTKLKYWLESSNNLKVCFFFKMDNWNQ